MSTSKNCENIKCAWIIVAALMLAVSEQQSLSGNTTTVSDTILITANITTRSQLCNVTTSFQIPDQCMTVTMTMDQFDTAINELIIGFNDNEINVGYTSHNQTDDICVTLSPQIQNCELRKYGPECYEIYNHKLTVLGSNLSTELGDYYLDSDKNAYMCLQYIWPSKHRPRCNYIQLDLGQYVLQEDGNLYINVTNTTIRKPIYTMDDEKRVNACYPLSIHFLNCHDLYARYMLPFLYKSEPGLKVWYREFQVIYNVDEYYTRNQAGQDVILCNPIYPLECIILIYLYNAFRFLGVILVSITVCHHLMAPKLTIHAKCLISWYVSMIIFYIFFIIPAMECYTYFILIYLSSNTGVFWMNIASYDVWRTFKNMHKSPNNRNGSSKSKSHRYMYYSIYGWGFPIVLLMISLLLDKYYIRQEDILFLIPTHGLTSNCWFRDMWFSVGLHFGILTSLSVVNAGFFIQTIYSLHKTSQGTELVNKQRKKQMYMVRFKLFVIMGLTLVTEGIVFCIQEQFPFPYQYIAEAFISTQGIAVFFAETCKKEAFQLMGHRFRQNIDKLLRKFNIPIPKKTDMQVSSTSQGTTTELQASSSQGSTTDTSV